MLATTMTSNIFIFFIMRATTVAAVINPSIQAQKAYLKFVNFERSTSDDTDRRRPYHLFPNSLSTKCVLDIACIIYGASSKCGRQLMSCFKSTTTHVVSSLNINKFVKRTDNFSYCLGNILWDVKRRMNVPTGSRYVQ